jgi:hypothetical protein
MRTSRITTSNLSNLFTQYPTLNEHFPRGLLQRQGTIHSRLDGSSSLCVTRSTVCNESISLLIGKAGSLTHILIPMAPIRWTHIDRSNDLLGQKLTVSIESMLRNVRRIMPHSSPNHHMSIWGLVGTQSFGSIFAPTQMKVVRRSEFFQLHRKSRRIPLEERKESLGYLPE